MIPGERQVAPTLDGIRADHTARYRWAARQLPAGRKVIDFATGCGYGSRILADAGHAALGFDIDAEAIEYAKKHYGSKPGERGAHFGIADGNSPGELLPADAAVCFETIEHIEDPRPLLKALAKSAPLLLASVPNEDVVHWERSPGVKTRFHFRHYTKGEFDALLRECGWIVSEWWGQDGTESDVERDIAGRTLIAVCKRAEASPAVRPTKIAIVGGAPSSAHLAPYDDASYEIWVHGNQIDRHAGKRVTRIFEIHDDLSEHGDPLKYAQMLVDKGIPMVVGELFPIKAAHVEVYPFEAVNRFMGEHLTSTPAYMMGYAMLRSDVKEIMIYGCDMAVDDHEYFYQRPVMYAWIGLAIGRGIKIGIPRASSLFKDPYVEGRKSGGKPKLGLGPFRESEFKLLHTKHGAKMAEIQDQIAKLQLTYAAHNGCQQTYEKLGSAARAIESGQHIETLTQTTVVI
ncbi:MAG: methyltransferase domain-containing protein [Deltaproteobacteria bacterium]|nr:methyltransferase domain-containing protein [Deltaproteobacteria bacterium]